MSIKQSICPYRERKNSLLNARKLKESCVRVVMSLCASVTTCENFARLRNSEDSLSDKIRKFYSNTFHFCAVSNSFLSDDILIHNLFTTSRTLYIYLYKSEVSFHILCNPPKYHISPASRQLVFLDILPPV